MHPASDCPHCLGACIVFICPEWNRSHGECCPHGTHKVGCLGQTVDCPSCRRAEDSEDYSQD